VGGSVPFDRAVEYYDRTRALPKEAHDQVIGIVAAELRGRGETLEIGVGTGRVGLDLASSGIPLIGLDLSLPMLLRLRENAGDAAVPIVQGDALALPFDDDAFGAALASHVFHLIADYPRALAELVRVVRPGGCVLASRGSPARPLGDLVATAWDAIGGGVIPGATTIEPVDDAARELGLAVRELEQVVARGAHRPRSVIRMAADRQWGWTWALADEQVAAMVDAMTAEAVARWGSVDELVDVEQLVEWHVYDVPGPS
jgi:ubiquinone/menaquinone biosynthesis C-methylase UbiE